MKDTPDSEQTSNYLPDYSIIYVERVALPYPDTTRVLNRFPRAEIVYLDNYKEIFNRPRQYWRAQKRSNKLILAVKRDGLLYPGPVMAQNCGHNRFFYNSIVMNCLYDCQYCYLQGLYPSAAVVLFVNGDDFVSEVAAEFQRGGPLYVAISYDSDLLALEQLLPQHERWHHFAQAHPEVLIESRTKSANFSAISHLKALTNIILAWTISPERVSKIVELRTPSFSRRVDAIQKAVAAGWNVRLCIDPMVYSPNWKDEYREMLEYLFARVDARLVNSALIGTLRLQKEHFAQMVEGGQHHTVLFEKTRIASGALGYEDTITHEMMSEIKGLLKLHGLAENLTYEAFVPGSLSA